MTSFLFCTCNLQLEQEIDLILENTGVFMQAVDDWTTKWAPAILEYGYMLTGTMVLTAQKIYGSTHELYVGQYTFICTYIHAYAHNVGYSLNLGDDDKKQKVALYLLCHLLAKKGSEETLIYIYEKCKVSVLHTCICNVCSIFYSALRVSLNLSICI